MAKSTSDPVELPEKTETTTETTTVKPSDLNKQKTPEAKTEQDSDIEHWKKQARTWEERAKRDEKDAAAYRKLTETKEQTATENSELKSRISALETRLMVSDAVIKHNIPQDYVSLVKGETEEEIAESAKLVADLVTQNHGVVHSSSTTGGEAANTSSTAAGRDRFLARKNRKEHANA
ncbi:hypothetical protein [Bowdeniella massiliensis]|uniref:hypothetical protein n=1 Tax=Bowdeniella massiliensis TaxID=2932264 RepID=UPI002028C763|nr:hypothetical protein [Bowdeniella massiliensis]